jgi:molybdenum cofactor cytidylyltransferase
MPANTPTPLSRASPRITGLVLAAGGSKRLGQPKQLLPYETLPLLGHVLQTARGCGFDQLLCVLGGHSPEVRKRIDFDGVTVVENPAFADGCSSSIAAALSAIEDTSEGLVLMLGDQPGVSLATIGALLARHGAAPLVACRYGDGRGHPLLFDRSLFGELAELHGDKAVWKLLDRHAGDVLDVPVDGPIPPDVDTWEDYRLLLSAAVSPTASPR